MKSFTTITLNQPNIQDFSQARNQAMAQANTKWILFLDQDETLTPLLRHEIDTVLSRLPIGTPDDIYAFKRQDWFLGRKLCFGETSRVRLIRLMPKNSGYWKGKIHEKFVSDFPVKTLKHPLLHHRRLSVSQFLDRINYYSSLRAEEINRFSIFELLFYPPVKFVKNYFWHLGFLDGLPGLAMAFMMSFHSLAVRVKQYEKMA